eukprot:878129-Amphidinium_carterae.1
MFATEQLLIHRCLPVCTFRLADSHLWLPAAASGTVGLWGSRMSHNTIALATGEVCPNFVVNAFSAGSACVQ